MPQGKTNIETLHKLITIDLETAGKASPYAADANEPDPRSRGYGVRAQGKKEIFATHRQSIRGLSVEQQNELATQLNCVTTQKMGRFSFDFLL